MTRHRKGSKRQARRASIAAKRGAFSTGNKKPLACAKGYAFDATGNPCKATGSEPAPHSTEVLAREFCS